MDSLIKNSGYTIVELIIFILVIAVGMGMLIAMSFALRSVHNIDSQTQAIELAKQRIEIIYLNRIRDGYANVADPCAVNHPQAICNTSDAAGHTISPSGFTVTSTITLGNLSSSGWSDNVSGIFKKVTVNVAGAANVSLNLLLSNY